jgi:hypothetical protein
VSQSLRRWSVFLPVALVAVLPVAARAQEAPLRSRFTARMAAVFDAEVCACDGTAVPTPRFRDLAIVAVGRQFPIRERATSRLELAWVPELIPILYSNRTASARLNVYSCGPRRYCGDSLDEDVFTVTAYGAGIMPLAFTLGWRALDRVRLRTRVSGGAVQLTHPVPLAQGTKFNFIADGSATVEFLASGSLAVTAGVGLNHISNGGLARVNLGMDSRMFEVGAVFGR